MDNDLLNIINQIAQERREHFTDFSLRVVVQSMGYSIHRIKLIPFTKYFGYKSGLKPVETLRAQISIYANNCGLLSYQSMLPHYGVSAEDISRAPVICDDLIVRLSIYPEGNGFFTPTWIRGFSNGISLSPSGDRIDWDIITNQSYKKTGIRSQKWIIPDMTFEEATATQEGNVKAIKLMLEKWFWSGVRH